MKYIVCSLLLFFSGAGFSQAVFSLLDADNSNAPVSNNQVFAHTVPSNGSSTHNFSVSNISSSTQTVIVKRYIQYVNTITASDKAEAVFSYDQINFSPNTYSYSAVATPSGNIQFDANLYEASIAGPSEVHYKFMNAADTLNNSIKIILKYNVSTVLKTEYKAFATVASLFPNPCNDQCSLIYFSERYTSNDELRICTAAGNELRKQKLVSKVGKNTLLISMETLDKGSYFIDLFINGQHFYQQLIVLK
jgi:hypothetical protein